MPPVIWMKNTICTTTIIGIHCGKFQVIWMKTGGEDGIMMRQMFSFSCDNMINPFPNKPWFLRVWIASLLKTQWEKEKLLITSNFSFPTVFSSVLDNFLPFSSNLKLSAANSFLSEEPKICRLGKG